MTTTASKSQKAAGAAGIRAALKDELGLHPRDETDLADATETLAGDLFAANYGRGLGITLADVAA